MNRGLIVSCQALPEEPLHSSFIMGKMAVAAMQGGAVGIRANSIPDILEIKKNIDLPIIGIIKKEYPDRKPYITPTYTEIDALIKAEVDIIALDTTIDQDETLLRSLKAAKAIEIGAYAVVLGTAITRPQCITKWFADAVNEVK